MSDRITVSETCVCGASTSVTSDFTLHIIQFLEAWRERHKDCDRLASQRGEVAISRGS